MKETKRKGNGKMKKSKRKKKGKNKEDLVLKKEGYKSKEEGKSKWE